MAEQLIINSYCKILDNKIIINDDTIFESNTSSKFAEFIKEAYKSLHINYPKFFKMDNLCKLGFLAADLLLKKEITEDNYNSEEISIIIANSSSSLDTDIEYQKTIQDKENYFPSPAVFVYTLPNILIGEICIKHKIMGENTFFISDNFDSNVIFEYVNTTFQNTQTKMCVFGWVELLKENYECALFIVKKTPIIENTNNNIIFEQENLKRIYNTK